MAEEFQNNQVFDDDIPSLISIDYMPITKRYVSKSILERSIPLVIIVTVIFAINIFNFFEIKVYMWIFYFILNVWILFWPLISVPKMFFALRERDLVFKHGVIWQSVTSVPLNRIQHVDVKQGPLDRKFQLSSLKVYTAGGSSGDLEINGLQMKEAEKIKQFIVEKIQFND